MAGVHPLQPLLHDHQIAVAVARDVLFAALGHSFARPELLEQALVHPSAQSGHAISPFERLEFLGDSVLGLVITSTLYRTYPDLPEGQLAKLRASVVNMRALAGVARSIGDAGLGAFVLLGKGEEATGGRDKASILADTCEALLGAIYLQHGNEVVEQVIHRLFDQVISDAAQLGVGLDWKTSLQELTASLGNGPPVYVITESGPDHAKQFHTTAKVAGEAVGAGRGHSKKEAEQHAAERAWRALKSSDTH